MRIVAALTALLHVLTARDGYGPFRDELYYVACGKHLSFGYVDHPPVIAWLAAAVTSGFGSSVFALRILPALAAGLTVVCVGKLTEELGGGRFAQALAGTTVALAPVYVANFGFFSMNAFDVLCWAAAVWLVARILRTRDLTLWLPIGLVLGFGLMNKISPIFLGFGLAVGFLATRDFVHFKTLHGWIAAGVAFLIFSPHLMWQVLHDWPTLTFIRNATATKNVALSPGAFLTEQALMMNPLAVPLALLGLWFLLFGRGRPFRALGFAYLAILGLMLVQNAKAYYFSPAYPIALAAGAVGLERVTGGRWWPRVATLGVLVASGFALAPLAKPVLPVERFVAYQAGLGLEPGTSERKEIGRLPQFFADRLGWRDLASDVSRVFRSLPERERDRACVFGQNYGQAGAIDFYRGELDLPPAISGHNSYFLWGPGSCDGSTMLVIGDDRATLEALFEEVELGATYTCEDCMPYESEKPIWVCRGLRGAVGDLWGRVRNYS